MNDISKKLRLIIKLSWLTQEALSKKFWVSFVTLNSWINAKSKPRTSAINAINEYYKSLTGQTVISDSELIAKKKFIKKKCNEIWSFYKLITNRSDIYVCSN
jgi:hypothetical protein